MANQAQHIAGLNIRGTITATTGVADREKLVRTNPDGIFDVSVMNPAFLADVAVRKQGKVAAELATPHDWSVTPANSLFAFERYSDGDSTLLRCVSKAPNQGCSIYVPIDIPYKFFEWEDNLAIAGGLLVNDQLSVSIDANVSEESFGSIADVAYVSMNKIPQPPNDLVEFQFTELLLNPSVNLVYGEQFNVAAPGVTYVKRIMLRLDVSFTAVDDFVQFNFIELNYKETLLEQQP